MRKFKIITCHYEITIECEWVIIEEDIRFGITVRDGDSVFKDKIVGCFKTWDYFIEEEYLIEKELKFNFIDPNEP